MEKIKFLFSLFLFSLGNLNFLSKISTRILLQILNSSEGFILSLRDLFRSIGPLILIKIRMLKYLSYLRSILCINSQYFFDQVNLNWIYILNLLPKRFEKMSLHQNQVQVDPNFIKFSLDKLTEIFVQRFVNLGHFAR